MNSRAEQPFAAKTIQIARNSPYFIAVCKEGRHSFLMLGVLCEDNKPKRLLSIGKRWDIEPLVQKGDLSTATRKACSFKGNGVLSAILEEMPFDEGKEGQRDWDREIKYKAYAITFEQYQGFLALIKAVEDEQNKLPGVSRGKGTKYQPIKGYVPTGVENDIITLTRQALPEGNTTLDSKIVSKLATEGSYITQSNTCRTSALSLLQEGFGFTPDVSSFFFRSPGYETILRGGDPDPATFYILPPPPNSFKGLSSFQVQILKLMHQQLNEIPKTKPELPVTRQKFDALKALYIDITSNTKSLNAAELLTKINTWERPHRALLGKFRGRHLPFSQTTATEKMLHDVKKILEKSSPGKSFNLIAQWIKKLFNQKPPKESTPPPPTAKM